MLKMKIRNAQCGGVYPKESTDRNAFKGTESAKVSLEITGSITSIVELHRAPSKSVAWVLHKSNSQFSLNQS